MYFFSFCQIRGVIFWFSTVIICDREVYEMMSASVYDLDCQKGGTSASKHRTLEITDHALLES